MTGQQGALNKFEAGDISGGFHDLGVWLENRFTGLEKQFPVLGQFVGQFASDFGKQVLSDAEALAPAVLAGTTKIQDAAAQLITQAAPQAVNIASADATQIALNALRVHVTALQAAPTSSPASAEAPAAS